MNKILRNIDSDDVTGGNDEIPSAETSVPSTATSIAPTASPAVSGPAPELKVSDNKWPMTHFHETANLPATAQAKADRNTVPQNLLDRLNLPLPSKRVELGKEHHFLYNLLQEQYGRLSKATRSLAASRHALVKAAINAMDNGPRPPRIGASELASLAIAHLSAPARRQKELALLEAALKLEGDKATMGAFGRMTIAPARKLPPGIECLLYERDIQFDLAWCRWNLAKYQAELLKNWGLVYPKERLAEIKAEHERGAEPDAINALNDEALALSLPTAAATSRSIRVALAEHWTENVAPALQSMIELCIETLEAAKESYLDTEKFVFERHPLKPEPSPTVFSTSFDPLIAQFKAYLAAHHKPIAMPNVTGPHPMDGNHTILQNVFALPILDEIGPVTRPYAASDDSSPSGSMAASASAA